VGSSCRLHPPKGVQVVNPGAGDAIPPRQRPVLAVSHDLDGLLPLQDRGLVASRFRPWGPPGFRRHPPETGPARRPVDLSAVRFARVTRPPCSSRTGALSLVCLRPHGRHHPSKLSPSTQLPARSLALRPPCRGELPRSRHPASRSPDSPNVAQLRLVLGSLPYPSQSPGWCSQAPRGRTVARLPASARLCPGRSRFPASNRSTCRAPQLATASVCSADHPCCFPSRRFADLCATLPLFRLLVGGVLPPASRPATSRLSSACPSVPRPSVSRSAGVVAPLGFLRSVVSATLPSADGNARSPAPSPGARKEPRSEPCSWASFDTLWWAPLGALLSRRRDLPSEER
jgi:hypothetical protein